MLAKYELLREVLKDGGGWSMKEGTVPTLGRSLPCSGLTSVGNTEGESFLILFTGGIDYFILKVDMGTKRVAFRGGGLGGFNVGDLGGSTEVVL